MSAPRVYVVCSHGLSMPRLLESVRRDYPDAEITAVYPAGHAVTEAELRHVDHTLFSVSHTMSALGGLGGLAQLARNIRATRPEEVVLQFESLKLRLFGIACRPRRLRAWLGSGQRLELPLEAGPSLADLYQHRARGYAAMLRAWWHAYVLGAINEPPDASRR
jgi:hypothetical protein